MGQQEVTSKSKFKKFDKGAIIEALLSVLDSESVNTILDVLNNKNEVLNQIRKDRLVADLGESERTILKLQKQKEELEAKAKDQYTLNEASLNNMSVQDSLIKDMQELRDLNVMIQNETKYQQKLKSRLKKYKDL